MSDPTTSRRSPLQEGRRHGQRLALLVGTFVLQFLPASLWAQEFRIYTRVYNEAPAAGAGSSQAARDPVIVGRSVSFFHAGKVYDYVDTAGEVTIFEPVLDRFTILNSSRMLVATLTLTELRQRLDESKLEAERYLLRAKSGDEPDARRLSSLIEFQLRPQFRESWDPQKRLLTLSSPDFTYEAQCAPAKSPEIVNTYLRYTDWTSQLNYLLHPQALLPGPRLALNASLRDKQMLPITVALKARIGTGIQLRAKHEISWQLDEQDRRWIHQWESVLNSPDVQRVEFAELQRAILAGSTRR